MSLISYKRGQGSIVLRVKILNSSVATGAGLTGLTNASSGLIISTIADNEATATTYTVAGSTIESITTLGTFAAPTATKCRFKEVDSTNHKGVYEIQIADARYAVSSARSLLVSISGATNAAETDAVIPLTDVDPYDAVRGGMTALPNANAGAANGLIINGTNSGTVTLAALTVTGTFTISDGLAVSRSTANSAAIVATGTGTGSGAVFTSGAGATGDGVQMTAASTNGSGLKLVKTGTGKDLNATTTSLIVPEVTLTDTATNLTNAPGSGDFTAAMKTSLNAATPAVTVSDKTGFSLAAAYDPAKTAASATSVTNLLAKLLKYAQLLARKDAAIATDNATELGEINANGGSGAGGYSNATDAHEALRDRGDAAWVTATGFAVPGDAMALTAPYNAAKTAAQQGDAMALVADAIDATAVAPSGSAEMAAAVLAAAAATPIKSDLKAINDAALKGTGVSGDAWGPA